MSKKSFTLFDYQDWKQAIDADSIVRYLIALEKRIDRLERYFNESQGRFKIADKKSNESTGGDSSPN